MQTEKFKNTPVAELESILCFIVETQSAAEIAKGLITSLIECPADHFTESERKGMLWALQLFNAMQAVQLSQTVHRCKLTVA